MEKVEEHQYWAVHCDTPNCPADVLLKYAGIYDPTQVPYRIPYLIDRPETVTVPCGCCGVFHEYPGRKIVLVRTEQAPGLNWEDVI